MLLVCSGAVAASPLPPYPFVTTGGKAEAWLKPDLGELQFDIVAQNTDPAAGLAVVSAAADELTALFVAHGVAEADIEAFDLGKKIIPVHQKQDGDPPFATIITRHMRVPVRDLAQWPALLGAVLGHDNIDNLRGAFDRSDREQLESQLALEAARNARQSAAQMAQAFGRKAGPVMAVSKGSMERVGAPFGFGPAAATGAAASRPDAPERGATNYAVPHALLLTQSVSAVFKLQ
jgi:uncharacterized protein YggE